MRVGRLSFKSPMVEYYEVLANGSSPLRGIVTRPSGDVRAECILLPGSGVYSEREVRDREHLLSVLAACFGDLNIRSFRVTKPIFGKSALKSEGIYAEYFYPVQAICKYISTLRDHATQPLILAGYSLGGHVAPYLASQLIKVQRVILLNAHVRSIGNLLRAQCFSAETASTRISSGASIFGFASTFYSKYLEESEVAAPDDQICNRPDLLYYCVNCGRDSQLGSKEQNLWKRVLPAEQTKFAYYAELDHGFRTYERRYIPQTDFPDCLSRPLLQWISTI